MQRLARLSAYCLRFHFAGPDGSVMVIEDQASGSTKQEGACSRRRSSSQFDRSHSAFGRAAPHRRACKRAHAPGRGVREARGRPRGARRQHLPDRLRKSVLQMAVQGKLVYRRTLANEPASVLLERIREQRRQLAAEKKMKATKGGESVIFTRFRWPPL